jgi:cyanophycin synthetase
MPRRGLATVCPLGEPRIGIGARTPGETVKEPSMEFRRIRALRGPNIWASFSVLEAQLDLGTYKDLSSDAMPGFNDRLMGWLPTMIEHRCSEGIRGGFFERLRRGTYLAHILEHVTLELQGLAGTEVGYGRARAASEEGVYKVVVEYDDEDLGRACLEVGRRLCLAAVHDTPFHVGAEVDRLREQARRVLPGPGLAAVLQAARKRDIPVLRLGGPMLQLGHGARQRRLSGTQTDRTGALASASARDNELTRTLLRAAGVPVPEGRPVTNGSDAWAAAEEVGLPVIVKPRYGRRRKCRRNLATQAEVIAACEAVAEETSSVLVERYADAAEWRLLVVGERVVAAARRMPSGPIDVLHQIHPDVAARAVEAARAVGLDVAGLDVVAPNLGQPLEQCGGVVVGVAANPTLDLHLQPGSATAQPAAEALLEGLFPHGQTGRVPIAAVTGVNGKTTTTRLITHLLSQTGRRVGMTCTEGIYIDGRRTEAGDCSGPQSARAVLQNPVVEAAVLETARGGILRAGLGFDRCDLAVVTNIAEGDHLGIADIETLADLARVKRTIVEAVSAQGTAVLKADDPLVAQMREYCRGHVLYFAREESVPVLAAHRSAGGRAAFVRDGWVMLAHGPEEVALAPLTYVPLTFGGRIAFQVENVLAAAGAAWALGAAPEAIRVGLETFVGDLDGTPGRFNLVELDGATLIFDYGHNPSSLANVIEALDAFPQRRRIAMYTAAGDRRDNDIVRQGELLGNAFDRVVLFEEENCIRGRKPGTIVSLFRQGLAKGRRVREIQQEEGGALRAAEMAFRTIRPGDLVLVQVEFVDKTVALIRRHLSELAGRRTPPYGNGPVASRPAVAAAV